MILEFSAAERCKIRTEASHDKVLIFVSVELLLALSNSGISQDVINLLYS